MDKIGLILEGGGMRGIYTAGVLDFFIAKNIEVGPSAPPIIAIAAAAISLNPISMASMYAPKIPNCAAAPSRKLFGFAISGPKSVIAPTPRKMSDGKIVHSSSR